MKCICVKKWDRKIVSEGRIFTHTILAVHLYLIPHAASRKTQRRDANPAQIVRYNVPRNQRTNKCLLVLRNDSRTVILPYRLRFVQDSFSKRSSMLSFLLPPSRPLSCKIYSRPDRLTDETVTRDFPTRLRQSRNPLRRTVRYRHLLVDP